MKSLNALAEIDEFKRHSRCLTDPAIEKQNIFTFVLNQISSECCIFQDKTSTLQTFEKSIHH